MSDENMACIGPEIKSLDHIIKRHIQHIVKNNGFEELTFMHGWILGYLMKHRDEPVYQKDIEKEFNVGRSSVTGMLKLMEQKGYIIRKQPENDARLKQLIITEKGIKSVEVIKNDRTVVEDALRSNLSDKDIENFLRIVEVMKTNLKELEDTKKK